MQGQSAQEIVARPPAEHGDLAVNCPPYPVRDIEWPTVTLGVGLFGVWIASIAVYFLWTKGTPWALASSVINMLVTYFGFTLMHEASHYNISRKHRTMNDLFGYLSGLWLHGSYRQFVPIHMKHHAFTNVHTQDPDCFTAGSNGPVSVLKWCLALWFYFRYFLKFEIYKKVANKSGIFVPYLMVYLFYVAALIWNFEKAAFLLYFLPSFMGAAIIILLFDYLPHHPHQATGRSTNSQTIVAKGWCFATMMQSHHVVHHAWPSVPWWRYRQIYRQTREAFLRTGHKESSF
jgi:beta-carotene hydroxylase